MTRIFNRKIHCEHCGNETTEESAFSRWIRDNPRLDANRESIVVADFDYTIHRFKTPILERHLQCMMFVEVKIHGGKVNDSQAKTLSMARQAAQNQHSDYIEKWVKDGPHGPKRLLRHYGGFELRLEGAAPDDSDWMEWNRKRITKQDLEKLIRFELNPHTLKPMDFRPDHHAKREKTFPLPFPALQPA